MEEKKISSSVSRRQNFDQDNARMKARNKEKHLFVLVFSDGAEWRSEKSRVWPGHDVRAAFDVGGQDNKHPSPPTKLLLVSPSLFDRRLSLYKSSFFSSFLTFSPFGCATPPLNKSKKKKIKFSFLEKQTWDAAVYLIARWPRAGFPISLFFADSMEIKSFLDVERRRNRILCTADDVFKKAQEGWWVSLCRG